LLLQRVYIIVVLLINLLLVRLVLGIGFLLLSTAVKCGTHEPTGGAAHYKLTPCDTSVLNKCSEQGKLMVSEAHIALSQVLSFDNFMMGRE
jgi:hypothetical protein